PNAVITNDKYPPSKRLQGVVIRRGAVIGANATLIAGIEVGEGAVVAAGSIVTRDVKPGTVVAGAPAKPMYSVDVYIEKRRIYESMG
ncbi:DapH/DapD/GlmU-related protein, partial [Caldivirga sp.]|uniref:DapH/DapD/GlmU-related protein n=1 Tax=Caldivirga sp. TaxID=2080243 RepID=UPI0025B98F08